MMIVIVFSIMAALFNYRVMMMVLNVSDGNGELMHILSVTQTFNNAICQPMRRVKLILNQNNYNGIHSIATTLNIYLDWEFSTIQCIFFKFLFNNPKKRCNLNPIVLDTWILSTPMSDNYSITGKCHIIIFSECYTIYIITHCNQKCEHIYKKESIDVTGICVLFVCFVICCIVIVVFLFDLFVFVLCFLCAFFVMWASVVHEVYCFAKKNFFLMADGLVFENKSFLKAGLILC